MTEAELQALVEKVSLDSFQRPFCHQAVFNHRLKTTGGRYHLQDHHLDFNPTLFQQVDQKTVIGIIKHELCHYHLHLLGKGYRHRDQDFKCLLKLTGGLRYAPQIDQTRQKSRKKPPKYFYHCQKCGFDYQRVRQVDLQKFVCGKCHGQLVADVS